MFDIFGPSSFFGFICHKRKTQSISETKRNIFCQVDEHVHHLSCQRRFHRYLRISLQNGVANWKSEIRTLLRKSTAAFVGLLRFFFLFNFCKVYINSRLRRSSRVDGPLIVLHALSYLRDTSQFQLWNNWKLEMRYLFIIFFSWRNHQHWFYYLFKSVSMFVE